MANTTTYYGNTVQVILDGSTDWDFETDVEADIGTREGFSLYSIRFIPIAVGDRMIIHNGGIDNPPVFDSGIVVDTACHIQYYNSRYRLHPIIDASDLTLDTAANARLYFDLY